MNLSSRGFSTWAASTTNREACAARKSGLISGGARSNLTNSGICSMTTPAQAATENAISLEVKKDGLSQRQSGDWSLRFTVASADMDRRLTEAQMGARFACVLVELNDDETPVDHKAEER